MKYPKNSLAQLVIASCIAEKIQDVVISPGSRNAPLSIGFHEAELINSYSIVDERSAAFIALGISQKTQKPSAVVCTSGSALLNYYPAVAEAYYTHIPLIVLSADRPKHMIDIGDGQTIRQEGVFNNHILFEANLTAGENDLDREMNTHLVKKAIQIADQQKGPVHINIPFNEPLYEFSETLLNFPERENGFEEVPLEVSALEGYAELWNRAAKKIVLVGVHQPDELLQTQINHIVKDPSVLVFTETTSNINNEKTINSIDQFLAGLTKGQEQTLQPDILLSIGGLVVSKRIKQLLRRLQPKQHWAVHPTVGYDTFGCLKKHFKLSTQLFFSQFFWLTKNNEESSFQASFLKTKVKAKQQHQNFIENTSYSDLKVFDIINKSLPKDIVLQLSNSSVIRYTQLFDLDNSLQVFCNRGTSGIDGSTSTAIGYAMKTDKQVTLITGDISFLYDSNALWNQYIPKRFRIILINNNGGGIFKILPGPKTSNALQYFETPHGLTAEHLSKMHDFEYVTAHDEVSLQKGLADFYKESDQPKILEVFTPSDVNDGVLKSYFQSFK